MPGHFIRNLSASTMQLVTNQLLGLVIFYLLSNGLGKNEFGELNWALAILFTAFNILSFGIDQVIVKKMAAGEDRPKLFSLHLLHVGFTGLLLYGLLAVLSAVFPGSDKLGLLLFLGLGKLMLFFASPFKQLAMGQEQFQVLMYLSICANLCKAAALVWMGFSGEISFFYVLVVFVLAEVAELALGAWMQRRLLRSSFSFKARRTDYAALVKESLPQLGVVLFSSGMARFDWIFIGLFVSAGSLAEYSFAYKVFEMATLPLLVVAPLLLPLFSRIFRQERQDLHENLSFLLKLEMIVAPLVAMVLNLLWTPLIDPLTGGKYGKVNEGTVFILSLCMPLLYMNNFLWSINFARGRTVMIFRSFLVSFLLLVVLDVLLIPLMGNEGAALAYLAAILAQTVIYSRKTGFAALAKGWQSLLTCSACALAAGLFAHNFLDHYGAALATALGLYFTGLLLTAQLQPSDWQRFKKAVVR
jgi:O-antigen/teichoic acid export membrane protein